MDAIGESSSRKKCCNPYSQHKSNKKVTAGLRQITQANCDANARLVPFLGAYWCDNCRKASPNLLVAPTGEAGPSHAVNEPNQSKEQKEPVAPELPQKCTFGVELQAQCDGLPVPMVELPEAELHAILWSSNLWIEMPKTATVCNSHYEEFIGFAISPRGSAQQGYCCDPFDKHLKTVKTGLRNANAISVVKAHKLGVSIGVGDPLCDNCRKRIDDEAAKMREDDDETVTPASSQDVDENQATSQGFSPTVTKEESKTILAHLGLPPLEPPNYTYYGKVNYVKRKLEEAEAVLKKKICVSVGIDESSLQNKSVTALQDLDFLMNAVKEKIPQVDGPTVIQLLTLCPPSWSLRYASDFFKVSRKSIQKAKALRDEEGILAKPTPRKGATLCEEAKNAVVAFYCHDDNSRIMPGKKDCVSMGKGRHEQKRLVLCTLRELYVKFKNEYPEEKHPNLKIGFSMFCTLRPKFCVLAGSSGTHNVCVCALHQNLKLKLQALQLDEELDDLIPEFMCARPTRECMLALCPNCTKSADVANKLRSKVLALWNSTRTEDDNEDEPRDYILHQDVEYSEWTSTDRSELLARSSTIEDLITQMSKDLRKVIPHDYISRQQSEFLKKTKENLSSTEAIVLMDFSMNYSCLLQDATQSYHWSKKQCTVHPVVIYFKGQDNTLQHKSFCFICPDVDHDVCMVQEIQEKIIKWIKENLSHIDEIMYMTDGCAAQYKNCKSFLNLCKHQELYGLKASWCFFATSHGKSACDGIGGLVKRMATLESLRRLGINQIVNADKLFEYCENSTLKDTIKFFFITIEEVKQRRMAAKESILTPITIPGTRSFHHFFPLSDSSIGCKRVSNDAEYSLVHPIFVQATEDEDWQENTFVAFLLDSKIYVGLVMDLNPEEREADISILHPPIPSTTLTWIEGLESYVAPYPHLLGVVQVVEKQDNNYELSNYEVLRIKHLAEQRRKVLRAQK